MARISKKTARKGFAIAPELMLVPLVVAMRLPVMALEQRSATGPGTETLRAINEKTAAVTDGLFAAQKSRFDAAWRFWPELLSGRTPSALNGIAAERAMTAALKPMAKTVGANFSRLSSKRP